jgi:hypothetical protein
MHAGGALRHLLSGIATIDPRVDYFRAAASDVELYARSDRYRVTRDVSYGPSANVRSSSDPCQGSIA